MTSELSMEDILPDESFLWKKEEVSHPALFELMSVEITEETLKGLRDINMFGLGTISFAVSFGPLAEVIMGLTTLMPSMHPTTHVNFIIQAQQSSHRLLQFLNDGDKPHGIYFHPRVEITEILVHSLYDTDLESRQAYNDLIASIERDGLENISLLEEEEPIFSFSEDARRVGKLPTRQPTGYWNPQSPEIN